MNYEHLKQADPELYASMERELARQRDHLELIASENFTSPAIASRACSMRWAAMV